MPNPSSPLGICVAAPHSLGLGTAQIGPRRMRSSLSDPFDLPIPRSGCRYWDDRTKLTGEEYENYDTSPSVSWKSVSGALNCETIMRPLTHIAIELCDSKALF